MIVALTRFPGKKFVVSIVNTGMGLPPVVVGLFVTVFLWRNGPFRFLGILYTPAAIILAQTVIATPIVMGISIAALQNLPAKMRLQILSLGATRLQMVWILIREARLPLMAAVMAGFGGVISEVGASIMVGGNILDYTRVLTTATVMETSKGNFDVAFALSDHTPVARVYRQLYIYPHSTKRETPVTPKETILSVENLKVELGGVSDPGHPFLFYP